MIIINKDQNHFQDHIQHQDGIYQLQQHQVQKVQHQIVHIQELYQN